MRSAQSGQLKAWDRPDLRLPNEQERLIRAVAAANPRTVVVLMSGGPVDTSNWGDAVAALLEAWYAGQEQGTAIARVLFGDTHPAGKLPLTWPRTGEQTPVATPAHYPGADGQVHYSEGIFVGYRGYDQLGIEPRYPFGYGLSYTSFAYRDLDVSPDGTRVGFQLTNTGLLRGTEIAQVYVGLPEAAEAPPKQLVGWARVRLEPGDSKRVEITLDPESTERPLSFWSSRRHAWEIATGEYRVYVGASSRDVRLTGAFRR